ncbi:MAG TPA: hypothetical protein VGD59_06255 [Acidisarcina sp.]
MRWMGLGIAILCVMALISPAVRGEDTPARNDRSEVRLRMVASSAGRHAPMPAVVWLEPVEGTPAVPFPPHGRYTLTQKNRMFMPHLLVIQAGSTVSFPNADPFFHNVFSLFDGKRFDLGLYEAGSSKDVVFSRQGLSYIFCNIHPEMSAVVLSLATPLYAVAGPDGVFLIHSVPAGTYRMNVWVEAVPQQTLTQLGRRVHIGSGATDLGVFHVEPLAPGTVSHTNEFGQTYDRNAKQPY